MNSTATKKVPPTNPYSVVTPDKGFVRKTKAKRPNYKLKKKKPDKAPKVITARKGLTFAALTTGKVGGTLPPNPYKSIPIPTITQSPTKPLYTSEIIEINSDDSEDDFEGPTPTVIDTGGTAVPTNTQVVIKMEPPDYLEGLTEADFEFDPDTRLDSVVDAGTASIPAPNPNPTPGATKPTQTLPEVTTIVSYLDGAEGYDTLMLLKNVACNRSSFHPSIVARVPPELVANVVVAREQDEQEFGIGNLSNPVQDLLTPLSRMLFGSVFENTGVARISDAGMMVAKNSIGEPCTTAAPFHLVFIPIPAVDKKPSSVNNVGQREFGDTGNYNQNFWKNHVEYRTPGNGNVTSWVNLSVKIPECLLGVTQRISHAEGLASLTNIGPVIGNDWMYMTLYGPYCHSFRFFMTSEVTIRARAFGFRPIFLMTNTLMQQTSWGVRNTRLVCCDRGAVSFLSMIGFWKQHSNNTDDVYLLGMNVDGNPLTSNYLIN